MKNIGPALAGSAGPVPPPLSGDYLGSVFAAVTQVHTRYRHYGISEDKSD